MRAHGAGLLVATLVLAAACRGDARGGADTAGGGGARLALPASARDSSNAATIQTPRGPVAVQGDSAANSPAVLAEPLQWTADAVMERLRQARLAPESRGPVQSAWIKVPGLRVAVASGAAEVQAYILGDAGAVGLATKSFDAGRASAGGRRATLVVDNNLAAVIVTADEALRGRLATALSARRGEGR